MNPKSINSNSDNIRNWLDRGIFLLAGLTITWFGLYLTIVRPIQQQMIATRQEMSQVQSSMLKLVGARDELFKTNDLLSLIRQQDRLIEGAKKSLSQLNEVRAEIAELYLKLKQDQADLLLAKQTVIDFGSLKQEILVQGLSWNEMQSAWKQLQCLQNELAISNNSLPSLVQTWRQIESLHQHVVSHKQTVEAAQETTDALLNMESKLAEKTPDMMMRADETLNQLVEFQLVLDQQSELVPKSLRNMETLGELEIEVASSVKRIQDMRRDLLDISLLEHSVKDALRVLAPVMQLTDAKRLNVDDVRAVARSLEERRNASSGCKSSYVSQQGKATFEFKPSSENYWDEPKTQVQTIFQQSEQFETPTLEMKPTVDQPVIPNVDMPE